MAFKVDFSAVPPAAIKPAYAKRGRSLLPRSSKNDVNELQTIVKSGDISRR